MRAIPQRQPLFLGGSIGGVPSFDLNFARGDNPVTKYGFSFTRATSATYVNASGLIATAASGELRYTYDPVTLSALGVLIEESRTNLVVTSSGAAAATGASVSSSGIAPDGSSANLITADGASSAHVVYIGSSATVSFTSGTTYTASAYVRAGTADRIQMTFSGAPFPVAGYVNFYLSGAGSVSFQSGATGTITGAGGGWYRISITEACTATNSGQTCIVSVLTGGTDGRIPTNTSSGTYYLSCSQLEAGSFPTSYIPTTGTAATRNADVLSLTGAADVVAPWFNKDAGTIVEKVAAQASTAFASATPVVWIDDGSANNRFGVRTQGGAYNGLYTVRSAGVAVADQVITAAFAYGVEKTIAYAYAVNDFQAAVNGSLNVPVTSGALPSGLTTVRIGRDSSAVTFTGTISRIRYYPRRLPNATLQSLTA